MTFPKSKTQNENPSNGFKKLKTRANTGQIHAYNVLYDISIHMSRPYDISIHISTPSTRPYISILPSMHTIMHIYYSCNGLTRAKHLYISCNTYLIHAKLSHAILSSCYSCNIHAMLFFYASFSTESSLPHGS